MATRSEKATLKRLEKEAAEYRKMIEGLERDKLKREEAEKKKAAAPKKRKTRKVLYPTKHEVAPNAYEKEFGPKPKPKPIKPTMARTSPNAYEKEFGFGLHKKR